MSSTIRACPSCKTTLPQDAVFCHKCGASTPMEINAATGEIHAPALSGLEDAARRAKLQVAVGDTVEIRRLLGRGGFAEVYVAYDRRLKREIAVKTIRGDLVVNDTLLERFQREAEAVAKLRHPHVVPIYSVGEANGLAYFTMPIIEGESLADLLDREGRLSVAEACRILRESANALHAAHRAGLVHRDIKPENIMLEGPERTAVVMDFGIAKTEGPEAKGLTGTGMLVGTPQYMSPEQATGERALDARSDQYSLAMVGYRMLTGRFPFAGDSVQQLIFKTVTEISLPASDLSSDVSKELSNVLAKSLSKAPGERYESMAAFSAAVAATDRDFDSGRTGVRGWRRPEPDMPTRIRLGMQALPRWRHPLVALAIAGVVATFAINEKFRSRVGTGIAANRSDAIFAAKAFLASRGMSVTSAAYPSFETRRPAQKFLEGTVGPDSTDRRAATDIPIWLWAIDFGKMKTGFWTVSVGPQNRIVGFAHTVPDSAQLPTLSHDSARVLAEREISARGWLPAALELVTDSTIRRKHRVDHLFRWRRHADAVAWRGADSGFVQVSATVRGDRVADYGTSLRVPEAYETEHETKVINKVLSGIGWTLAVILCGFAFGLGVTRQRVDQLQWGTALRLLGVAAVALCFVGIPKIVTGVATAGNSSAFFAMLIVFPIMIAMATSAILFVAVVGESLAREKRPSMVQGIEDLSRGRLGIPEVMTGVLWGYVAGFIATGAGALLEFVAWRGFGSTAVPGKVSLVFGWSLPSMFGIVMVANGIVGAFGIMYAVIFLARGRLTARMAMVLPGLIAALMFAASPDLTGLGLGLTVLIFSVVVWHFGFIAALIGLWIPDLIKEGVSLVSSGTTEFVTAGLVTLALGLAPLALALVLYRRFRRTV